MLKELWKLIKMLFATKPNDVENVELLGMNHFPFSGYKYMMWCGKMIYRNDTLKKRQKEWKTKSFKVSKNHETIHLVQAKQCGSWWKYYLKYFWEWIKGNPIIHPASSAYYTIPFESEAYANDDDFVYCSNYDGSNLSKYTFKDRKDLYRSFGCSSKKFKEWLKTL